MRRLAVLLIASTVALAGCGDGADTVEPRDGAAGRGASSSPGAPPSGDPKDLTMKPAVTVPSTPPPTTLQTEDIVVGTGAEATTGKPVEMHYVGVSYSTGEQFDASWDSGTPFPFTLGAGNVIKGWDEGIVGMKVGGRRRLTIPPDLGYGPEGYPPVIAPNETLVFVVDLLSVG